MSKSKQPKHRGRPPKYVRDNKGREVVGLGYNKAVNQYYLTFSSPRIYIGCDKHKAIETFYKQKEHERLPPDAKDEAKRKEEIYNKALDLLNYNECIQEQLVQKARAELDKIFLHEASFIAHIDTAMKRALKKNLSDPSLYNTKMYLTLFLYTNYAPEVIKNKLFFSNSNNCTLDLEQIQKYIGNLIFKDVFKDTVHDYLKNMLSSNSINEAVQQVVEGKIKEEADRLFENDNDSLVWDKAYDLILEDPIKAAMLTGIKELAYLSLCPDNKDYFHKLQCYKHVQLPMPWWLVWDIFICHQKTYKRSIDIDLDVARCLWMYIGIFIGYQKSVDSVTEKEIKEALCFNFHNIDSLEKRYLPYLWNEIKHELKSVESSYTLGLIPDDAKRLSIVGKIEILKAISGRVFKLGYEQCSTLVGILNPKISQT